MGSGDFRILAVFSADKLVLVDSLNSDLKPTLESFVAQCEAAKMNLSTSMFVARVLCWERMDYALHVREDLLEFKYHGSRVTGKAKGCCAGVLW